METQNFTKLTKYIQFNSIFYYAEKFHEGTEQYRSIEIHKENLRLKVKYCMTWS